MLIEQIQRYLPEALTRFSMETRYRLQVGSYINKIAESSVAFDLGEVLELDHIYVDVVLWEKDSLLKMLDAYHERRIREEERWAKEKEKRVKNETSQRPKKVRIAASVEDIKQLISVYRGWPEFSPEALEKSLEKAKPEYKILHNSENGEKEKIVSGYFTKIELDAIFDPACRRAISYLEQIPRLSNSETSIIECTRIAHEGIQLRQALHQFQRANIVKKHWDSLLDPSLMSAPSPTSWSLMASCLLKIKECLYVTGGAGSGKTTLLRRLSQTMVQTGQNELPLFLPLISVEEPTYDGLVLACLNELNRRGYGSDRRPLSVTSFRSLIDTGKFRLFFDGLDETGAKADDLMRAIDTFGRKHEKAHIVLSSRDTFGFETWPRAYAIGLEPFSDKQLELFIGKWFSSEPSSKQELLSWLAKNPQMRASAQTPLVGALLCSLFQLKADMPSTEVDLYERRFELLLGRWDRAKGIQPLRTEIRKRYMHFLMAFAFHLHSIEKRSAITSEAVTFARRYYDERFHRTPEAMMQDCVRRGLFEYDQEGNLSFGHLTYQEYLAAEWLCQHGPVKFIWSRILTPWWTKTLEFYAARKLDITPLVKNGLAYRGESSSFERICALVNLAPLTSKEVMTKFRRLPRSESLPQYKWKPLPRPPLPL